jgi:hypothetical protein
VRSPSDVAGMTSDPEGIHSPVRMSSVLDVQTRAYGCLGEG